MPKNSIEALLEAAAYLDRKEVAECSSSRFTTIGIADSHLCEVDHGYAATPPMPYQRPRQRTKSRSKAHTSLHRYTHNELEKSRRAQLRRSLDRLKVVVPLGVNETRHTTVGLLEKAQSFIRMLEEKSEQSMQELQQLMRCHDYWSERLNQAMGAGGRYRDRRRHSDGSPVSVTDSTSSEQDVVDVLGYGGSSQSSDADETSRDAADYAIQTSALRISH